MARVSLRPAADRAVLASTQISAGPFRVITSDRGDQATSPQPVRIYANMIRKLKSGQFRLYSRKKDAGTGKRRNLGTFTSLEQAKQHEREVQYFKRH